MKLKNVLALCAAALTIVGLAPASHANGLIIPAYLTLTDTTDWNILKEDAAIMQSGTNPNYKDYWVTVNSSNNGPFSNSSDWTTAATLWDPIRANGGKIFGYVHTLQTPGGELFRSLTDVEADITAWVNGYPNLDGIWIDEFYPRYEIADTSGTSATYPNGLADAPTNKGFVNADGSFNGQQVNPAGGYYSQLTSWIRTHYPNLKLIGNAGGQFYSNQVNYYTLVDVTCSFEDTYAKAANSPTNNWAGLVQQTTGNPQLAIIHTNTTDLDGAIDESISHGFTHFFTTDRNITENLYGGIPSYFTTEVTYIADHS